MKKSYFYGMMTVLIWATMATIVKVLLEDIPNLEALAVSSLFAFLFLLIVNLANGHLKALKAFTPRDLLHMAVLGFLGLFLYSALYYFGLAHLTSQEACILNYLWPVMLVLFSAIILKERLTLMKIIAMICSFLGIIILTSGGTGSAADGNRILGIVSCIAAAACYGLFSVLNKKADYDQNITMMIIWLTVTLCAAVVGPLTETWVVIHGMQWLGILWLGVVIDAVAYLLWALALAGTTNTAAVANLAYLTPFLSILISALVLGEQIHLNALIALLFIIGGILLQSIYDRRHSASVVNQ